MSCRGTHACIHACAHAHARTHTQTHLLAACRLPCSDSLPAHQPGLAVLRESSPFCRHMLSCSLLLLSAAVEGTGRWEAEGGTSKEKDVADMVSVFGR